MPMSPFDSMLEFIRQLLLKSSSPIKLQISETFESQRRAKVPLMPSCVSSLSLIWFPGSLISFVRLRTRLWLEVPSTPGPFRLVYNLDPWTDTASAARAQLPGPSTWLDSTRDWYGVILILCLHAYELQKPRESPMPNVKSLERYSNRVYSSLSGCGSKSKPSPKLPRSNQAVARGLRSESGFWSLRLHCQLVQDPWDWEIECCCYNRQSQQPPYCLQNNKGTSIPAPSPALRWCKPWSLQS